MTIDAIYEHTGRPAALGFSVHCTEGALGEWFTVIPRSPDTATALRGRGVNARASLTAQEVRGQLGRLGLASYDIDALLSSARRCSTIITAPGRIGRWSLRRWLR